MKNSEVIENINGLSVLKSKEEKLPVKVSYAISKNMKLLVNEYKDFEEEKKNLVEQYGTIKEDETFKIKDEYITKWEEDIKELLHYENDIAVHKIKIDMLEGMDLSVNDLIALDFMLEE